MIKNILYSLLLHSTFAFLIYFNFHHIIHDKIDLKDGLVIGSVSLQDLTDANKTTTKSAENTKTTKKIIKENITKKESPIKIKPKKKPKSTQKKSAEKTEAKSPTNPTIESKSEFKKKEEEKIEKTELEKAEEKIEEDFDDDKKAEEKPAKEELKQEVATADTTNNDVSDFQNLENLQLSAREKFNIQAQLKACYSRSLAETAKSNFVAIVKVTILEDGTISFDEDKIIDIERYNNPQEVNYKNRMDSIILALELCSPLRNMPVDKYEIWREFTIEFGGE